MSHRPWYHLSVDFITYLPSSNSYSTILVAINRFSIACHLITLKGLPTAMETAKALCHQVIRVYGLPEDIVSDQRTQFTSRVWGVFCHQLDINVSLNSLQSKKAADISEHTVVVNNSSGVPPLARIYSELTHSLFHRTNTISVCLYKPH